MYNFNKCVLAVLCLRFLKYCLSPCPCRIHICTSLFVGVFLFSYLGLVISLVYLLNVNLMPYLCFWLILETNLIYLLFIHLSSPSTFLIFYHTQLATEEAKNFRDRNIFIVLVPNKAVLQKAQEPPKKKDKPAVNEVSAGV